MEKRKAGRPRSEGSASTRLLAYMKQCNRPMSGRELKAWAKIQEMHIEAFNQARFRLVKAGDVRRRDDADVIRWEVVE